MHNRRTTAHAAAACHNDSSISQQAFDQVFPDELLRCVVDGRKRVVEQINISAAVGGSCKCDALPLAARQAYSFLCHGRLVSKRHGGKVLGERAGVNHSLISLEVDWLLEADDVVLYR